MQSWFSESAEKRTVHICEVQFLADQLHHALE